MRRSFVTDVLYPGAGCVLPRVGSDMRLPSAPPAPTRLQAPRPPPAQPTSPKPTHGVCRHRRSLPVSDQAGSDGCVRRARCQAEGVARRRATSRNASSSSRAGSCIRPPSRWPATRSTSHRRPRREGCRVRPADVVRRRPRFRAASAPRMQELFKKYIGAFAAALSR